MILTSVRLKPGDFYHTDIYMEDLIKIGAICKANGFKGYSVGVYTAPTGRGKPDEMTITLDFEPNESDRPNEAEHLSGPFASSDNTNGDDSTIVEIVVKGNKHLNREGILSLSGLRIGDSSTKAALDAADRNLTSTGLFGADVLVRE